MSRAQLKHVLLDVDFLNNPKVRALKAKFSHLSQLCLIDIYSAMSRATNAIIDHDCMEAILLEYAVQMEFIDYCLDKGLIQKESNGYSNSVVIKDQEALYKNQTRWRQNRDKNKTSTSQAQIPHVPSACKSEILNTEDLNIDINKSQPPEVDSKFAYLVPEVLEPPDNSNQFINMGKLKLKKYPEIYLTPFEFCDVLEQYEQDGIPIDDRKFYQNAFKNVNTRIATHRAQGKTVDFTNAYAWLIGFAKSELLTQYKKHLDLKRSEKYNTEAGL